jgi:glycosyltransferase involved in cell wall biosynthesis
MSSPIISVVCSVKNGENTIGLTIESIINQSFKDWEFIIVDDGSTDNTSLIINEYAKQDMRIKFIKTDGVGRGNALNLAIKNSKGYYIANIDADDPSHPQRLEFQYLALKKNKEFSLVSTNYSLISGDEDPYWENIDCTSIDNIKVIDITHNLIRNNPINHSSILVKKKDLENVGLYDVDRQCLFDYDLWIRLAQHSYRLGYINQKLSTKRFHKNQSFENKKRLNYLQESLKLQKRAIINLNGNVLDYLFAYGRFVYGLLPQNVRKLLKIVWSRDGVLW